MDSTPSAVLNEVIAILRRSCSDKGRTILPTTKLLVDLDLDSLQMLDFVESLKVEFGVDFFALGVPPADLATPQDIARRIQSSRDSPAESKPSPEALD